MELLPRGIEVSSTMFENMKKNNQKKLQNGQKI
jgi:hypothetical protein